MFLSFYLVKNHKIDNNLTTATEAREEISADLESLNFLMYIWLNLDTVKFYLI